MPIPGQIYHQVARDIRSGAIHYQVQLPSTRLMARLLRISTNTVLAAYDDLAADDVFAEKKAPDCESTEAPRSLR